MNYAASFTISAFTNPSGEVVFRVSGWLDGKRIRKNYPSRAEAKAETDALEIQCLQGETGVRPTVTRLTEDQLHEAEAVFKRLSGKSHSMSFCVDFALANYRSMTWPVADTTASCRRSCFERRPRRALRARQVRRRRAPGANGRNEGSGGCAESRGRSCRKRSVQECRKRDYSPFMNIVSQRGQGG